MSLTKLFKALALISCTIATLLTQTTQTQAEGPSPIYVSALIWIKDHSQILPYRQEALPFVLEQGGTWTHLSFPDSFMEKGFGEKAIPDEFHLMQFHSIAHMRSIFGAPEYQSAYTDHAVNAFGRIDTLIMESEELASPTWQNYDGYFAFAAIELKDASDQRAFLHTFKQAALPFGLQAITETTPLSPALEAQPNLALLARFDDKDSFDRFIAGRGRVLLDSMSRKFAIAGGYDTKRPN